MYAVIRTGGKQYRVTENDRLVVERLAAEPGETVRLGDVLMIGEQGEAPTIGTPVVEAAAVTAEVVEQRRADKVLVFKKKRRKNFRRLRGHRQAQTVVRIASISASAASPTASKGGAPAIETAVEGPSEAAEGGEKE